MCPRPSSAPEDLRANLVRELLARARRLWPTVRVDEELFVSSLLERLEREPDLADALLARAGDLYIAFASVAGDREGLRILQTTFLTRVAASLERMRFVPTVIDETMQELRAALLLDRGERPPQLRDFVGRGSLGGWLQVVASRIAYRLARPAARLVALEDAMPVEESGDIELAYLKKTYGPGFRAAFHEALAGLAPSDRLLLKQKFSQQMTVAALGLLYKRHPSNVSRRITEVRRELVAATRAAMMRDLGLERSEMSSLLRLIQSEVDLTFSTQGALDAHELP